MILSYYPSGVLSSATAPEVSDFHLESLYEAPMIGVLFGLALLLIPLFCKRRLSSSIRKSERPKKAGSKPRRYAAGYQSLEEAAECEARRQKAKRQGRHG